MRRPLIGARDLEASIGQGEQAQGVMEAHQGRGHNVYVEKQEGGIGRVCVRIRHEKNL
jgi:hypothetical protein